METFAERERIDRARHLERCAVCRNKLRCDRDHRLYAVKNARTREFIHVLVNGESLESKLGWPREEILYSMLVENGATKAPPMSEDTKDRLRIAAAERKLKKSLRADTPARPEEGGEKGEPMASKKAKKTRAKKPQAAKPRAKNGADKFLPDRFVRAHGGKDHTFERTDGGWRLDGGEPVPLRRAMAELMGEANAKATSFVRYFRADKVRKPEADA